MMGNRLPFSALAIAAALAASGAKAQSEGTAHGRTVFDKKGCQNCHSYVSRRGAPSVRDMLREFEGEPLRVLKGIGAVGQHREALSGGNVSDAELRLLAEWLGADLLPDAEDEVKPQTAGQAAAQSAPVSPAAPAAAPVAALPATSPAATQAVAAVALPSATAPAPELRRPATSIGGAAISGVRIQSFGETGGDRLIIELRGGEPDTVDMSAAGNRFVVSISGVGLAGIPTRIPADGAFKVIEAVETRDDGHTVTITVVPRDTGWTYSGMQGRNRLVVDFAAQAKPVLATTQGTTPAATPAASQPLGSSASAPVKAATGGAAAVGAGVAAAGTAAAANAGKATADKLAGKSAMGTGDASPLTGKAAVQPKPVSKGVEQKVVEKQAVQPKVTEAKAAELKAAEQAKAQEVARKAELARAAEQARAKEQAEAAARAKAADDAARKRELERSAESAKAPAAALAKADPMADPGLSDAAEGKERRKLKKNRPYKEANLGPCPPPNPADQVIGVVDVERAKDIIDRIGCPQCHAYVQKKTGTPFREVLKKYKGDPACVIHRLKTNETHKDEGVTADIRADEFKILADYVATRLK